MGIIALSSKVVVKMQQGSVCSCLARSLSLMKDSCGFRGIFERNSDRRLWFWCLGLCIVPDTCVPCLETHPPSPRQHHSRTAPVLFFCQNWVFSEFHIDSSMYYRWFFKDQVSELLKVSIRLNQSPHSHPKLSDGLQS